MTTTAITWLLRLGTIATAPVTGPLACTGTALWLISTYLLQARYGYLHQPPPIAFTARLADNLATALMFPAVACLMPWINPLENGSLASTLARIIDRQKRPH